jgi:hypothetical protein
LIPLLNFDLRSGGVNQALQETLGPNTPVYESPQKGYSAIELLRILLGKTSASDLCTKKPRGVRTFASFIVDLNSVHLKDLHADDNGSWVTSFPRRRYEVEMDGDDIISATLADSTNNNAVTLYRQYGTHKGESAFKRIIATVNDSDGKCYPKAVVQYYFLGGKPLAVRIPSHGNASNSSTPYYRTQPSTLKVIKQECKTKSPSMVYHHVLEEAGGVSTSMSVSEEPRNKSQVYNARKHCSLRYESKDEIFDILEMLQNHQTSTDGGFLREVAVSSTPSAVLATKQQLDNLVVFCCQPGKFAILGVDATFQLGDFYVTLTTYHNYMLINPRSKKPPVFIGPAFLHMERRCEDYHTFFSCLLKLKPQLASLKAYGTDGEGALVKALQCCFKESIGLRCFVHKRRNLEARLKATSASVRKEILIDIFGMQEGDIFNTGLVDSASKEAFDENVEKLRIRWERLVPGFMNWFLKEEADIFKNFMITDVREKALLGSPPERYTTNSNESSNCVVKKWVGFKRSSWPAFVEKLKELVDAQLSESYKAVYRSGDYILSPELSSFHVDQLKWHQMTPKQRVAHMAKISAAIKANGQNLDTSKYGDLSLPSCSKEQHKLSVRTCDVTLPTVAQATLVGIWAKAERLLSETGLVLPSPGSKAAYIVASESLKKPHFVQLCSNGKVVCDEHCPMWRGRKLCAHTVAVAEKANCLQKFVDWIQKSRHQECNITSLVTTSKERKSAGTKSGNPGRKRPSVTPKACVSSFCSRIDDVQEVEDIGRSPEKSISLCASNACISNVNVGADGNSSSFPWTPPSYYHPSVPYSYPHGYSSSWYGFSTPHQFHNTPPSPWSCPSPINEQLPYVVKLLNNRIKKCRGCGSLFARKADGSVPDPPNDLVVAHEERQPFADANNKTRLSRPQNVYYHPNVACIRRHNASFLGPEIQVSADTTLLDLHKKYLSEHFGWDEL